MVKKRNLLIVIALVFVMLSFFTACDNKPKHEHTYASKWEYNDKQHWHPATCGCTDLKSDVADHTFDEGKITTAPSYGATGVKTYTCTVCGSTKTKEVDALEAKDGDVVLASGSLNKTYDGLPVQLSAASLVRIENEETKPVVPESIESIKFKVKDASTYLENAPINAGSYTAEVTVKDTGEWKGGTYTFDFSISQIKIKDDYYHKEAKTFNIEDKNQVVFNDVTLKHKDNPGILKGEEIKLYNIYSESNGAGTDINAYYEYDNINYDLSEFNVWLTIEKAELKNDNINKELSLNIKLFDETKAIEENYLEADLEYVFEDLSWDKIGTLRIYPYNKSHKAKVGLTEEGKEIKIFTADLSEEEILAAIKEGYTGFAEDVFYAVVHSDNFKSSGKEFHQVGTLDILPVKLQNLNVERDYNGTSEIIKVLSDSALTPKDKLELVVTTDKPDVGAVYSSHEIRLNGVKTDLFKVEDHSNIRVTINPKALNWDPTGSSEGYSYYNTLYLQKDGQDLKERTFVMGKINGVVGNDDVKVRLYNEGTNWSGSNQVWPLSAEIIGGSKDNYKVINPIRLITNSESITKREKITEFKSDPIKIKQEGGGYRQKVYYFDAKSGSEYIIKFENGPMNTKIVVLNGEGTHYYCENNTCEYKARKDETVYIYFNMPDDSTADLTVNKVVHIVGPVFPI